MKPVKQSDSIGNKLNSAGPAKAMCPHCGISQCMTSHFRFADVPYLALLRVPVRCHSCQVRFHVGYRTALEMLHERQSRSFLVAEAKRRLAQESGESHAAQELR